MCLTVSKTVEGSLHQKLLQPHAFGHSQSSPENASQQESLRSVACKHGAPDLQGVCLVTPRTLPDKGHIWHMLHSAQLIAHTHTALPVSYSQEPQSSSTSEPAVPAAATAPSSSLMSRSASSSSPSPPLAAASAPAVPFSAAGGMSIGTCPRGLAVAACAAPDVSRLCGLGKVGTQDVHDGKTRRELPEGVVVIRPMYDPSNRLSA